MAFLLFWLHLDCQSFKFVAKEILSAPSWWCINKPWDCLLSYSYLAPFNYLSVIIADQSNSFHGQVGSVIGQNSKYR